MPPSRRHRGQPHHMSPTSEADGTDNDMDLGARQEEHDMDGEDDDDGEDEGDELVGLEDEDDQGDQDDDGHDEEEDDDGLVSPSQGASLPNLDPPPPYFREISTLASWTVSSAKPGCSIPQLRHANTNLFWQSDGPQPHYLNIHFFKLVRIVGLRLYLDFEQDESYTPTRIIFLAGSGMNDLQEWGEMKLESPRGWVWADFSGVGDVDSEGDDDDDAADEDGHDHHHQGNTNTTYGARIPSPLTNGGGGGATAVQHDASSDSENAAPFTRHHHHHHHHPSSFHTPVPSQTHPHHTPLPTSSFDSHPHHHHHHHHHHHPSSSFSHPHSTPSLPHTSSHYPPRTPFTSLSSSHPSHPYPRRAPPPRRPLAPKLPTLRAHLLQVKILENHQNGKDTHLRGLQVFARNDEDVGVAKVEVAKGKDGMAEARTNKNKKKRVEQREERYELGTGIGIGAMGYAGDVR